MKTEKQKQYNKEYMQRYRLLYPTRVIETRKKVYVMEKFRWFIRKIERMLDKCIDCGEQEYCKGYCERCYRKYQARKLYKQNPQKTIQSQVTYQKTHPEVKKRNAQKFAQRHKEELNAYQREWGKRNPLRKLERNIRSLKKIADKFPMKTHHFLRALQAWSNAIKIRDKNKCQICKLEGEISHHILHKSKHPELSLNLNNGITLCIKHHKEVHGWS